MQYISNSTPKQSFKGMLSGIGAQQKHIILTKPLADGNPSTPQKFSIAKNLKVLNVPSQQDSSFRSSSQKKLLTSESPAMVSQNKENGYVTKRVSTDQSFIENQVNQLIQENRKLNDMISRQYKEKQELINIIEKMRQNDVSRDSVVDLPNLRGRIDRLEQIIDSQSDEILEWKQKYRQACEGEDRLCAVEQMESQIMQVVEENERLNNLKEEKDRELKHLGDCLHKAIEQHHLTELKLAEQSQVLLAYEDELRRFKAQHDEDKAKISSLEGQLRLDRSEDLQSIPQSLGQSQCQSDRSVQKEQFQILDILQSLEQQLSELSTQYTYQQLENQKLLRLNNQLREEINQQQRMIDEMKGAQGQAGKGQAVNPKFQEVSKTVKVIRDRIVKAIIKQ